jgi:hypothetical protein
MSIKIFEDLWKALVAITPETKDILLGPFMRQALGKA